MPENGSEMHFKDTNRLYLLYLSILYLRYSPTLRNREVERGVEWSGAVCCFIAYFGIGFTAPFASVRSFGGFFREMAPGLNLSGSACKRERERERERERGNEMR